MTKYQIDLMAVIRQKHPEMTVHELEMAAITLYNEIKTALDESLERVNKK